MSAAGALAVRTSGLGRRHGHTPVLRDCRTGADGTTIDSGRLGVQSLR